MEINLKKASVSKQKLNGRQTNIAPNFSLSLLAFCFVGFVRICPVLASGFFRSFCMTLSFRKRGFSISFHKKPLLEMTK